MSKKRFGQHFLSDPRILDRIVEFSRVSSGDTVVEIGPGRGALTSRLARKAQRVIAIEVDRDLIAPLRARMPPNVEILERDALEVDFATVAPAGYPLVANLPYNIATALIDRFIRARGVIGAVTVMVQKEVADRILAAAGSREYGPLSIGVQYYADVERGFILPPGAFYPPPKVHSRMIRLTWRHRVADAPEFIRFVRTAFASRRKTLLNNLAPVFPHVKREALVHLLKQNGIRHDARPEQLSVAEFMKLFEALKEAENGDRKNLETNPI